MGKDQGQCALMTGASSVVSMAVSQDKPVQSKTKVPMHLQL